MCVHLIQPNPNPIPNPNTELESNPSPNPIILSPPPNPNPTPTRTPAANPRCTELECFLREAYEGREARGTYASRLEIAD